MWCVSVCVCVCLSSAWVHMYLVHCVVGIPPSHKLKFPENATDDDVSFLLLMIHRALEIMEVSYVGRNTKHSCQAVSRIRTEGGQPAVCAAVSRNTTEGGQHPGLRSKTILNNHKMFSSSCSSLQLF